MKTSDGLSRRQWLARLSFLTLSFGIGGTFGCKQDAVPTVPSKPGRLPPKPPARQHGKQ